ncbi:hypothetical protein THIOM_002559 [Candidatus Thiomargarita nelsonii]|uniref:Uncharacterized protein n=1 Tax=Candidatus Thiomargarita nelsonii TaxID=1003181 RepID=A0A176S179_9GAMM|nr:hypothetical protein THIOM_002559 [Candidatus Thiomargarita nelsonii]
MANSAPISTVTVLSSSAIWAPKPKLSINIRLDMVFGEAGRCVTTSCRRQMV